MRNTIAITDRDNKSFNPRTRVGCETVGITGVVWWRCFNPRTRVGCEAQLDKYTINGQVSIHAPVWGANPKLQDVNIGWLVSIHAPVWGAKKFF